MTRALISLILFGITMVYAYSMLPGCAAPSEWTYQDVKPAITLNGEARSLVMPTEAVTDLAEQNRNAYEPWYYDRLGRGLSVDAGYRSATVRTVYSRTYDSVHSGSNGQVHDRYHQRTYRSRYTETVE